MASLDALTVLSIDRSQDAVSPHHSTQKSIFSIKHYRMNNYLRTLSTTQWLKNGLIFIPAVFAAVTWDARLIVELVLAFLSFSFVASAVYIHNDISDIEADRKHPRKQFRPIASGKISIAHARILQFALLSAGIGSLFLISWFVALLAVIYVVVNLLYSSGLKQVAPIDMLFILSGYYIRLLIGQEIAHAPLSSWVLVTAGLLATYLVLIKRYGDVELYKSTGVLHRKTVPFYAKIAPKITSTVLANLIAIVYGCYIHFVFARYPGHFSYLPYVTIPLVYIAILLFHRKALQEPQRDPLVLLLKNTPSFLLAVVSFGFLIATLYPVV